MLRMKKNENTKKENTYNLFFNDNFNHSRSSSSSNETANSLSIASSSNSTSTPQTLHPKKQQIPYTSENLNSTVAPPSSNSETEEYSNYHQSSSKVRLGVNQKSL